MCRLQRQTFCTCCKKRMYVFTPYEKPVQTACFCTFAKIHIISYQNCLSCKEDCTDICEPGDLPVKIYYMPKSNKCYMFFQAKYDDDLCLYYTYYFTRVPLPAIE